MPFREFARPLMLLIALALIPLVLLQTVVAADWPRWRGPGNDGHAPAESNPTDSLPPEPAVIWQVPAGEGLASPVVADGRVFAFDAQEGKETLRALAADTGRELWRVSVDAPFSDSQGPTGPRNTPVVDGDRVYAVSCRGELQCRTTADGSLVWRANFVKDFQAVFIGESGSAQGASRHGNNGSPLIDGEHLLVAVGGTNGAGVVCFDKRTGAVAWKSASDQAGYAPPVVATFHGERQVVCFTAEGLVGLRRSDGLERWRFPIRTSFARHVTTPVVRDDLVVVSSHQAGLFGIRIAKEGDVWKATAAWSGKEAAMNFASPVAVDGHLYGLGPRRNLVCVEIATGKVRWSRDGVFITSADKAYGGFVAVGGRSVLALTDHGELVLFAADPTGYRELGRSQIAAANWTNPALADGVVYVRDGLKKTGQWKAVRLR
ncbi:MAG: PQQ-binding-like beta-propeller repeat protein [Limisphaerales bacterium]